MFKFIGRFFGSNHIETKQKIIQQPVISNKLRYNPNLIKELENDHKILLKEYGKIWSDGFAKENYVEAIRLISNFKNLFQAHLLVENIRFYAYLEQNLNDDSENLKIVKEFRLDMNKIARAATNFCRKYQTQFSEKHIEKFEVDYKTVGKVLTQRIDLEENSLYILYQES